MSQKPISLNPVKGRAAILRVGDFSLPEGEGRIDVRVPGGEVITLPIVKGEPIGTAWGWDGSADKPTLKPDIKTKGWSGSITSGQLT